MLTYVYVDLCGRFANGHVRISFYSGSSSALAVLIHSEHRYSYFAPFESPAIFSLFDVNSRPFLLLTRLVHLYYYIHGEDRWDLLLSLSFCGTEYRRERQFGKRPIYFWF